MEKWKPIKGYEGIYEVSNYGRVRSYHSKESKVLRARINKNGYEMVGLHMDTRRRMCYVHRLVAEAFLGGCPDGHEVDHINRDRLNNHADNLRYLPVGENHSQAKYSKYKAVQQFTLSGGFVAEYPSRKEAARKTGVERRRICLAAMGKIKNAGGFIWRNVSQEGNK